MYTFGFGSDHDADMLEAISTQGGGVYYYIDTNEKVCVCVCTCVCVCVCVYVWTGVLSVDHLPCAVSDSRVVCRLSGWPAECDGAECECEASDSR